MNFKKYFFLFKWFLIGKYHCDLSFISKKTFYIIHKIFWSIIILSVAFSSASFISIFI
ncbi:hypothetical protein CAV_0541 [Campylobacter avium LMG 24591]|uniref:Uncharacterized protein n=1 Tax=Campylobacter avium LMG 24591 TaxID=522484 RepID=A0A222MX11_9BACT|nr:hypothetical protein [Campylobacter avium]ASQ30208.1 hypothetical protein CAV_0541 [Campylobacter avium LMG 24591]OYD79306.1 hypothetical protein CAV8706_0543 [Campylobacter avium]